MYKQPIVEAAELQGGPVMQAGSPNGLPFDQTEIPGGQGGD